MNEIQFRVMRRVIRGLAKMSGADMVAYDAEIARLESLSPDQLKQETDRKLAEILAMRKGGQ